MMLPSHLLATLLLGMLLSRGRFSGRDWLLAVAFGVLVDLDHLLQVPRYVADHGAAALLHPLEVLRWGGAWQGFLHTPWAVPVVLGVAVLARSWLPPVFWALHMVQDFVVARHLVPFGGPLEWAVVALLAAALGLALHLGRGEATLRAHAARTFRLPLPSGDAAPAPVPAEA